jgi:hypothetical protein
VRSTNLHEDHICDVECVHSAADKWATHVEHHGRRMTYEFGDDGQRLTDRQIKRMSEDERSGFVLRGVLPR